MSCLVCKESLVRVSDTSHTVSYDRCNPTRMNNHHQPHAKDFPYTPRICLHIFPNPITSSADNNLVAASGMNGCRQIPATRSVSSVMAYVA
jgi:hypothetical protein